MVSDRAYPTQQGDKHWTHRQPERVPRGECRYNARLTEEKVLEMRRLYASGRFTYRKLAALFALDPCHARDVVIGRKWAHVGEAVVPR